MFRLNFSHGTREEKDEIVNKIRAVERKYNHPIGILGDLQGPKIRTGVFEDEKGFAVKKGEIFRFDSDVETPGNAARVHLPHPEIIIASEVGHKLLVDDGKLALTVVEKGIDYLDCVVENDGIIKDRKGVNTPDSIMDISPMTEKDRLDLAHMLTLGVDWVALSFVQRVSDVDELNALIGDYLEDIRHDSGRLSPILKEENLPDFSVYRPAVMSKIEKPSCFWEGEMEKIIGASDGIMVARGDLGVECPPEDVPILQKELITACRFAGKPVVVATQMLESMIDNPTPTRAEASDISTAIYDGADAIMLSGESASGKYPIESVEMQQRIVNRVEINEGYVRELRVNNPPAVASSSGSVLSASQQVADSVKAKAIVIFTLTGTTVGIASRGRPTTPILAVTPREDSARRLSMTWGVYPTVSEIAPGANFDDGIVSAACRAALTKGLVNNPNDLLIVIAGLPIGTRGAANCLRVVPAAGPLCWEGFCQVED